MYQPIKSAAKLQQEQAARKAYANHAFKNATFAAYEKEAWKGKRSWFVCAMYLYPVEVGAQKFERCDLLATCEMSITEFENFDAFSVAILRLQETAKQLLISGRSAGCLQLFQQDLLGLERRK